MQCATSQQLQAGVDVMIRYALRGHSPRLVVIDVCTFWQLKTPKLSVPLHVERQLFLGDRGSHLDRGHTSDDLAVCELRMLVGVPA